MKIWVTKYALSNGVRVCEGTVKDGMAKVKWKGALNGEAYFHGKDFQLSEEGARERLREMIAAKRKSLRKQSEKLDDLEALAVLPAWRGR